jgi:hypothetical protein
MRRSISMRKMEIFDPAMCCATGVCGPSIDPELMIIATVINSLKEKGIIIKRHGLANEPQDFITNKVISDLLQKEGVEVLPVTLVDGVVAKIKAYPTNEEIEKWLETKIDSKPSIITSSSCCGPQGCC